jgi:hypothetical protein
MKREHGSFRNRYRDASARSTEALERDLDEHYA